MLESLNYSFRNKKKKNNLSNLPHQKVEKLQKNHRVLRGPHFGKQRWRPRLGILRGKRILLQKRSLVSGPVWSRGFQVVWASRYHDIRHVQVVRLSASRTGRLYPQECSWYSFSLGAESTPGPWYGRKEIYHWKSIDTTGNRSQDRPTSSAAP